MKFNIKHLLVLTFAVAIAISLQVSLNQAIATFKRDIEDAGSTHHRDAIQTFLDDYSVLPINVNELSVTDVNFHSNPTLIDYFLFRRTIECRYNLAIYHYQQLSNTGEVVTIPLPLETEQTTQLKANPFVCTVQNK